MHQTIPRYYLSSISRAVIMITLRNSFGKYLFFLYFLYFVPWSDSSGLGVRQIPVGYNSLTTGHQISNEINQTLGYIIPFTAQWVSGYLPFLYTCTKKKLYKIQPNCCMFNFWTNTVSETNLASVKFVVLSIRHYTNLIL